MSEKVARLGGAAAIAGGASWVVYFGMFVAVSAPLGQSVYNTTASDTEVWLLAPFFIAALLGLGLGGWGLRARLAGQHPVLGYLGAGFGSLSMGFALFCAVKLPGLLGAGNPMGAPAGMGVMSMCIGTTLVGIGILRARSLPGAMRFLPLALGLTAFPSIILIGMLGAIFPGYIVDELPFALIGLAWIAVGYALRSTHQARVRRELAAAV